jgi:aminoglycoside/choline kinase family phosphotransferase
MSKRPRIVKGSATPVTTPASPHAVRIFVALSRAGLPASERLEPLAGDASTRAYVRVHFAGVPSLVAMVLPADARRSDEGSAGAAPAEIPFVNVQRYLRAGGVPVPEIRAVDEEAGILLLEDLGDDLLHGVAGDEAGRKLWYEKAVDEIVRIQTLGRERPDPSCIAFQRRFDERLLEWELEHFVVNTLVRRRDVELPPAERAEVSRIFRLLAARLASAPATLVHRDFQSRNLLRQGERLRVIDFQDALLGPAVYDLVALLRDSYVSLTGGEIDRLLGRYVRATGVESDALRASFDWQTVQRKLKDAGRFDFIDLVRKNPTFMQWQPRSLAYVKEAAARQPELAPLAEIFGRWVPELRG